MDGARDFAGESLPDNGQRDAAPGQALMTAKAGAESALGTDVLARLRVASTERALGAEGLPGLSGYFGLDMEPPTDTGPAGGAAAMPATYTVLPTDTGPVGGIGTTDHGSA